MTKNIMLNTWVEDFSKFIAVESFKLVKSIGEPKGLGVVKKLSVRFLGHYVEALVTSALTEYKERKLSGDKAYQLTSANFLDIKVSVQNEVASAFEAAFRKHSGQYCEYYCQIKPVPEPLNKEVC